MEDNKDFEKGQFEEQGTQQMPDVPDGNDDGEGKKPTVNLFGHEFDRKKAVAVGLSGLLVLALAGGGIVYAVSHQPAHQAKEPEPVVQADAGDEAEQVVQLGAKAEGWAKDESSPVIAHIVNDEEGIDFYHAYDANATEALAVPEEGGYEVSFIAPVNVDGSTYKAPDTGKAQAEADNHNKMVNLPYTFEAIKAEDVEDEDISAILSAVNEAVKKGDETLTGENGVKVVELVEKNLKANPNADAEKVEEEADKAADGAQGAGQVSDKGDMGTDGTGSTGGSNSGSGSSGNGNSNANSGSNNGGNGEPSHTHNWVAETTIVHHDAQYKTVHHDAVTEYRNICNGCGADITGNETAHTENAMISGNYACGAWHGEQKIVQPAWDETVLVSEAWDETITTGYKCSCGATK